MKLLLFDENISPRLADTLTHIYPGAVHVNAIGLDKAFDRDIWDYARQNESCNNGELESQPTFVTINESDFWRKTAINNRFCMVCFALPDSRACEISQRLRTLLDQPLFDTKKKRMGK